ncbi:DUF4190 domain-containing protein [Streptomyces neyagawaensis]|nr:DUF4190 domain-containing protein [Streptomyces neyagawaensis]MCL6736579.1 DUF4190 domain-containing protein [Streptomyces neyagawaensis]MDE1686808.1 DUF4190 domain-containing protein [Streptomyces neyagawaensis]
MPGPGAPFAPQDPAAHTYPPHLPGAMSGAPVPPPPISPDGPGQFPYGYAPYPGGGPGPAGHTHTSGYGWPLMPPPPSNGMGIASMVLGICAATLFCMWPLAILLGVMAVIFGIIGRAKASRGEATNPGHALAGIICGIAGFLMGIGFFVLIVVAPDGTDESDTDVFDDGYDTSLSLVLPTENTPPPLAHPATPSR